MVELD